MTKEELISYLSITDRDELILTITRETDALQEYLKHKLLILNHEMQSIEQASEMNRKLGEFEYGLY